jgi:hypothetical protein
VLCSVGLYWSDMNWKRDLCDEFNCKFCVNPLASLEMKMKIQTEVLPNVTTSLWHQAVNINKYVLYDKLGHEGLSTGLL